MFFSAELLARRDSGFGLLWLAATLGSKSTFKKLPKRSVLTADITQLCDLIAEPAEPLALRLSSNLMVGVARVYKVKQEIFMSDVTTCFNSLKRVVQEFQSAAHADAQLQMAQPTVRSSALTLVADPRTAFAMNFDDLVADWDEYLNIGEKAGPEEDDPDEDFNPKAKQKGKAKASAFPESLRADIYTLKEHHDHLLSTSFDLSFNGSGGVDPSSSQVEGGFEFDDNFFPASDGLDVGGGLGDELARELGEGWGGSPMKDRQPDTHFDLPLDPMFDDADMGMDLGFDFGGDAPFMDEGLVEMYLDVDPAAVTPQKTPPKKKVASGSNKENRPLSSLQRPALTPRSALSPATSFSRLLLSQDEEPQPQPLIDITANDQNQNNYGTKKIKRTRLLLDARTELTDDELKAARAQYIQGQDLLRREIGHRKSEKDSGRIIEEIVWGVPKGIHAQVLVDFWQENFKVQVEARSGAFHIRAPDEPPAKRRKIRELPPIDELSEANHAEASAFDQDFDMGIDMDIDMGLRMGGNFHDEANLDRDHDRLRSSEDPEQARRVSRPPSVLGSNFGFDLGIQDPLAGSQRSSLFPWDNAGAISSSDAPFRPPGEGSDKISVDHAEVRLRGSPLSRRESSLVPSQTGSAVCGRGFSPAAFGKNSQLIGEDYAFNVGPPNNSAILESQQSDINLITLERNSFNFLEYARMQEHSSTANLTFDIVVPEATSTRHVAAAAFYHCLVLATKDLLRLKQGDPYGAVVITIV